MKKIIDLNKIEKLLKGSTSAYAISEKTGLTRAMVNRYRTGDTSFENMTVKTALRLQKFYDDFYSKQKISYDSSELIVELEKDIEEFGPNFECWVWFKTIDGAKVYTDYDFKGEPLDDKEIQIAKENGEEFEILKSGHLLKKLEQQNEIL